MSIVKHKHSGFTLIEISVVLVIIGLLAGGIILGRDMVHAAEIRAQIKQIQDYQAAFSEFETKYDCVPGDCNNFSSYFPTDTAGNPVLNGNGNGLIENNNGLSYDIDNGAPVGFVQTSWDNSQEYRQFFIQLSLAQLVPGNFNADTIGSYGIGTSFPPLVLNSHSSFFAGDTSSFNTDRTPYRTTSLRVGRNALWFVACNLMSDPSKDPNQSNNEMNYWDNNCGIFLPSDLFAIDSKIDDGNPLTGKFFGFGGYPNYVDDGHPPLGSNAISADGTSGNACLTTSGDPIAAIIAQSTTAFFYDFTQTTPQCQAAYVLE